MPWLSRRHESVCFWCGMSYTTRYVLTSIDDIKKVASGVLSGVEKYTSIGEERRYDITLVINELLVNSFEHARPSEQSPVVCRAGVAGGQLCIGVTDGGCGFAHEPCANVVDDMLFRERGRGLKLVRAICQEVKYNDSGNSVEVKIVL